MIKYAGKSVNQGIAAGRIKLYRKEEQSFKRGSEYDPEQELDRYEAAKQMAGTQLQSLYLKTLGSVGKESAGIFEMQEAMLDDLDYTDSVHNKIVDEKVSADYAVSYAGEYFSALFSELEDEYMRARAADIRDITERLLSCLKGGGEKELELEEPSIILAEDLTPSETIQLDPEKVLGFVTRKGSANSHTAILARMMDIPALVNADIPMTDEMDRQEAVLDGFRGELIVDPDEAILDDIKKMKLEKGREIEIDQAYIGRESVTKDGRRICIYANIGDVTDLPAVIMNDADGVGLFRSEFLFLGRDTCPTEEEQFLAYKQAAETMAGKKTIIRTLDVGADKRVPYIKLDKEENPAMGFRAIRISLTDLELFRTQLRAIYRASAFGHLAVMYPMIISVQEIEQIIEICEEVKADLAKEGIVFREIEQGIMIETPAAVMISDELAKKVDFFSIGTNDLTQYTLAIDRQNEKLDRFYDSHHPAVLRMIRMVIENGHREGCWVGICGELGADTTLTQTFIDMGIDELSVSSAFVLPIRRIVCNL